ncbi:MAG: PIG-L family deacetylase [Endomicrobiales bacterium]|nr:PIG-L family deacetylase [Endomicrobiales bacterium]
MINFIRYSKVFRLYEYVQPLLKYSLIVDKDFPGGNALVIAPHPDDEAVGCGGAVRILSEMGGSVDVVFCTSDGQKRDEEAGAAAKVLGVKNTIELKYPVESLSRQSELPDKIMQIVAEKKPDIIFLPFVLDNHADHRAANSAFLKAHDRNKFSCMVYAYPVWMPLYPNVLIDIGGAWDKKKEAIECYKSQLETRDYVKMAGSLGEYWAGVKGHGFKMLESYYRASAAEYAKMVQKLSGI